MWHFSGGYWKVGNVGADQITISDNRFKTSDTSNVIANSTAEFELALPGAVKSEIAAGKNIIAVAKARNGANLEALFDTSCMRIKMDSSKVYFNAVPKFNFINTNDLSYHHFVTNPKPNKVIPFVDPAYGYNIYSVFGNGYTARQINGWIDKNAPESMTNMPSGRIHPIMVKDSAGALKSGYKIMIDGQLKNSDGFSIGQGTFNNAGACGLHFEFPVEFIFFSAPATTSGGIDEPMDPATVDPVGTIPAPTSGCGDVIKWSDPEPHSYKHSPGCKTRKLADGTSQRYCPGHTCTHIHNYESSLTANVTLNPTTLKSGYGFTVSANTSISTKEIPNSGTCGTFRTKASVKTPVPPVAGEVQVGWVYKNETGSQKKTLPMQKISATSTTSTFQMPMNSLSPKKERKVYTAVELAGTTKKPVKHNVSIVLHGGGVPGVAEFCTTLVKQITINGNMYEDDHTSGV